MVQLHQACGILQSINSSLVLGRLSAGNERRAYATAVNTGKQAGV